MKTAYLSSLILFLSSTLIHVYLSFRSYSLRTDKAIGKTLCRISESWNCDQALTSAFSEIFSIPLSNFGFALNAVAFLSLILIQWRWLEPRKIWSNWVWLVALLLALGSVVMFLISLIFLDTFCPFCTLCYIFSILVLWPLKKFLPSSQVLKLGSFKPLLWIASATAVFVIVLQAIGLERFSIRDLKIMAQANFIDWQNAPPAPVLEKDLSFLSSGPDRAKAKLTIVEFADFLCPHCAYTYEVLTTIQNTNPSIRVEYMSFPLNPKGCTEKESSSDPSISCYLSKAVFCTEKQKKGLQIQSLFYKKQKLFSSYSKINQTQNKVFEYLQQLNVNKQQFQKCMASMDVLESMNQHILIGRSLGIRGTPSLFVEGRSIPPTAIQLTLTSILKSSHSR